MDFGKYYWEMKFNYKFPGLRRRMLSAKRARIRAVEKEIAKIGVS